MKILQNANDVANIANYAKRSDECLCILSSNEVKLLETLSENQNDQTKFIECYDILAKNIVQVTELCHMFNEQKSMTAVIFCDKRDEIFHTTILRIIQTLSE